MSDIRQIQNKILEIMRYIDTLCRRNDIEYCIMGGTALGAVRHGGFIPWDDDLDIFMTIQNYRKFKQAFEENGDERFVLQEWSVDGKYLEYAKVRMNGTTFIEEAFADRKDMHHGIYVDIMILHRCPDNKAVQYLLYLMSKFIVLTGLSQRNWKPKSLFQKVAFGIVGFLPAKRLSGAFFKVIYRFDETLKNRFKWCYFITKASFDGGVFEREIFDETEDIAFEDTVLKAPKRIGTYLRRRYGDYMRLPPVQERKEAIHAAIADAYKDYKEYV